MIFEGVIDGKEVMIEHDGDSQPCSLYIRFIGPDVVVFDGEEFQNASSLSASLVCELGHHDACWFLHNAGVPADSKLWALNHSGYPGDDFFRRG